MVHLDIYRLDNDSEFDALGLEEFWDFQGITVVEWAEKILPRFPPDYILIKIFFFKDQERIIEIEARGQANIVLRQFVAVCPQFQLKSETPV